MKRAVRIIGTLGALACIGYLILRQAPQLPALDWTAPGLWGGLALALVCYLASQVAAAEAWRAILSFWQVPLRPRLARSQPLISQIGKYIPGNVAHLFGRLVIGRHDGVSGGVLAAGILLEVAFTLAAGFIVAGLLLTLMPATLAPLAETYPTLGAVLSPLPLAVVLLTSGAIAAFVLRARLRRIYVPPPGLPQLGIPLAFHLATFPLLGLSLWATAGAVVPDGGPDLVTCVLVFAVAWVAGFIVPGAPGGIGIRDSIIVLGLAASVGDGSGLAIALLHRAVSVAGDVATFGIGWTLRRGTVSQKEPKAASFAAN